MSVDLIRYDLLVQDALRAVVRRVLTDVARDGLPGDHHLYVSFDTTAPGVRLSPRLKEKYPEEMTIVLQHQFWDLIVTDTSFEVGLSFNGIPERLFVPFINLKGFFDPSVKFGLQFEPAGIEEAEELEEEDGSARVPLAPVPATPRPAAVPTSVPVTRPAAVAPAKSEPKSEAKARNEAKPDAKPAPARPAEVKHPAVAQEAKQESKDTSKDAPKGGAKEPAKADPKGDEDKADAKNDAKNDSGGGAQVVRLDAFRKK